MDDKADRSAFIKRLLDGMRAASDEELEDLCQGLITQGQCFWDSYYQDAPLLGWFAEEWCKNPGKRNDKA